MEGWVKGRREWLVPAVLAATLLAGCGIEGDPARGEVADTTDVAGSGPGGADHRTSEARHVLTLSPDRPSTTGLDSTRLEGALAVADTLPRLRCLLVARHGEILVERCAGGGDPGSPANVKSVSKSVLSALVGIAIDEGHLEDVDQRVAPLLAGHLDTIADPRKREITIGHLLSMQSGLERTSGGNYAGWVSSANWVRNAIRRPMVADPGDRMLYSTGNYHLLSAILTDVTGVSTLELTRRYLGHPLGIRVPPWVVDPQGIYFGGNDMRLSPRAMVRFGELYRNGGRHGGEQVVPESWVRASLVPRTRSRWSGEAYGYGWFISDADGHPMFYAWGYGGQFVMVVPNLELTVVTTSDPAGPRGGGHVRAIHDLVDDWIAPAAAIGAGARTERTPS